MNRWFNDNLMKYHENKLIGLKYVMGDIFIGLYRTINTSSLVK
jgi:hypothetical protein